MKCYFRLREYDETGGAGRTWIMCKLQWAPWVSTSSGFEHLHTAWFLLSGVYLREVVMFCGVQWRSLWEGGLSALQAPEPFTCILTHVWYLCQGTMSFSLISTVWCMFQGMGDGRHAWGSLWVRCGATAGPRHSRLLPRPTTSMVRPKEWRSKTSGPCPWSFAHLRIYLLELLFLTNWSQKPKDGAGKL